MAKCNRSNATETGCSLPSLLSSPSKRTQPFTFDTSNYTSVNGAGSFSLGCGGLGDKMNRRIVRARRRGASTSNVSSLSCPVPSGSREDDPTSSSTSENTFTSATAIPGERRIDPNKDQTVEQVISLKVVIEKKNKKVLFVECNKDFVDGIFSFLTLPIGSILRLLNGIWPPAVVERHGCLSNIYESVGNLNTCQFKNEACKKMLLQPRILSKAYHKNLKLKIEDGKAKCFYFCQNEACRKEGKARLSEFPCFRCHCGRVMDQMATLVETVENAVADDEGGVFIREGTQVFLLGDDMQVMPGMTSFNMLLLKQFGIREVDELEIRHVDFGNKQLTTCMFLFKSHTLVHLRCESETVYIKKAVLTKLVRSYAALLSTADSKNSASSFTKDSCILDCLLDQFLWPSLFFPLRILKLFWFILVSKTPLTNWILEDTISSLEKLEPQNIIEPVNERCATEISQKMSLTLIFCKSMKKVLYAECREEFVDFLFSFLTFPLGSVSRVLDGKSQVVCLDNIYKSVGDLSAHGYFKSEEAKSMLCCPRLPPHVAYKNNLLQIEETLHPLYLLVCAGGSKPEWLVYPAHTALSDIILGESTELVSAIVNPKSCDGQAACNGGFIKGTATFMITDELVVMLLSPASSISFIGESNVAITDIDEVTVEVGEEEAKNILRAALLSKTALTDVFSRTCLDQLASKNLGVDLETLKI